MSHCNITVSYDFEAMRQGRQGPGRPINGPYAFSLPRADLENQGGTVAATFFSQGRRIKVKQAGEIFQMLQKPCDNNILKALKLAEQMIFLAQKGDEEREDSGCGILYGVLLDSGFKLRELARRERDKHMKKGWWKESEKDVEKA